MVAMRRYKWLMLLVVILATLGGIAATKIVTPQFEVHASILIAGENPQETRTGPIRSAQLLNADDWSALIRSFAITDVVVRRLSLYLQIDDAASNGRLFNGFELQDPFRPGEYELQVNRSRKRWVLVSHPAGAVVDSGGVADSLGRHLGFGWKLDRAAFDGSGDRKVTFFIATPRETAVDLIARLNSSRQKESNFLRLTLQDPDPALAARIMNTWVREFISVAAALKRRKLADFANTLEGQLQTSKNQLDSSEVRLSAFRVNTITLPSEGGVPIAAGLAETRDPVMRDYFTRKIEYEDLKHDVTLLERLLASVAKDSIPSDALLEIRSGANSPETSNLRTAIAEFHTAENALAQQRVALTDDHPSVKALITQLNQLKHGRIPSLAGDLLASSTRRSGRISRSTRRSCRPTSRSRRPTASSSTISSSCRRTSGPARSTRR